MPRQLIDPYGSPVPGTEALADYYASNPDIAGGTYGGALPSFQAKDLTSLSALDTLDMPFVLNEETRFPGPVTSPGTLDYVGTDFTGYGGASMPQDFMGGVDFPSLRDVILGSVSEIPNIIEAFQGAAPGLLPYQRRAPNAPLLGGACPPGRVLRRVSLGRDKCVKKPHMNVCNRHALARSTRRVAGFLHMAKNTEKKMRQSFGGLLKSGRSSSRRGGRCGGCGQTAARCAC